MKQILICAFLMTAGTRAYAGPGHATPGDQTEVASLATKLVRAFDLAPAQAHAHAEAALAAQTDGLSAEVLLAVAAKESSFRHRLHGKLKNRAGTISRFCGVLQAASKGSAKRCAQLTQLLDGYAAGALEIAEWLNGRCKGSLDCALACHGCGNSGLSGACAAYPRSIWARLGNMRAGTAYPVRRARRTAHD